MKNCLIAAFLFLYLSPFHLDASSKAFKKAPNPQEYQYRVCIAAIFQNEADYFKEWIEYHKLLGVEHFRLYNNDSTDHYLEVLEPYILSGEVTLIDWPTSHQRIGIRHEWVWTTQFSALSDAIMNLKWKSKWLALIDVDEFILPLEDSTIPAFLQEYEPEAGVLINWQNFGTSGIWDIPEDKLMIETFIWKAREDSSYNHPVKSIVRPERIDLTKKAWCPHTWSYFSPKHQWILPNHKKWKIGKVDISKVRINHYVHKTERYFYEQKVAKKEKMEGRVLSQKYIDDWKGSCNQVVDTEIFRFVPDLRKRVLERD